MFRAIRVKLYLDRMEERGFSSEMVLAGSQIESGQLQNPDYVIDIWQTQRVIANMIALTKNNAIGFEFGKSIKHSDLGIVGYAMMSCKNMLDAIDLWLKYGHSLVGTLIKIWKEQQEESWSLTFSEIAPMGRLFQFCVEENMSMGVKRIENMLGVPLVLAKLELSYPKPAHFKLYTEEFNCPIIFDSNVSKMTIQSPSINTPIKSCDNELHQACLIHCNHLLESISQEQPIARQIRNILVKKAGHIPSFTEAASLMNFSPRTLSRLLKSEGTSYQCLLNTYRCELAKTYINGLNLSNKEIGYLLGYEDTKTFLAAFKCWTGITMSEYRKQIK